MKKLGAKAQRILDEHRSGLSARQIAHKTGASVSYVYEVLGRANSEREMQQGARSEDANPRNTDGGSAGSSPQPNRGPEVSSDKTTSGARPVFPMFNGDAVPIDWTKSAEPNPDAKPSEVVDGDDGGAGRSVFVGLQAQAMPAMVRTVVEKSDSLVLDPMESGLLAILDDIARQVDDIGDDRPGFDLPPTAAFAAVGVVSVLLLIRVTKRAKAALPEVSLQSEQKGASEETTPTPEDGPPDLGGGGVLSNLLRLEQA